ncbi:MAG: hypothetical protein QNM02_08585 [Acidimicrobiia bacterium]|nr:hypothetical protein [Acidimicrobiia bacterium]
MGPTRSHRSPLIAASIAAVLVLAACGGGGGDGSADADGAGDSATAEDGSDILTTAGIDLGGAEVGSASEVESNLFPDLVVDDIGRGKKVNIRNIVPSDKPVLLWMWAPH